MSVSVSSHVLSKGAVRYLGLRNSGGLCHDPSTLDDLDP